MNKPTTYGISYDATWGSYTVVVDGMHTRSFQTNAAALAYIDQSKSAQAAPGSPEMIRRAARAQEAK
jgi:hypothetical protein